MREFSQKRKVRKFIFSVPVLIFLFIILFLVIKGSYGVYQKYSLTKSELENSQSDLVVLEDKKTNLENKIDRLQTETGIEREIRSKFDVAREGEKLIVIVEDKVEEEIVIEKENVIGKVFTTIGEWFQ
jgi:cell division protein FtsB